MLKKNSIYLENIQHLIFLDSVVMLMLSITSAGKNLIYTLYQQEDYYFLAPLQYICNYLFGPLTLLIVDTLISKWNFKILFYISSFNLNLFLIGALLVSGCENQCDRTVVYLVTILTSLIAGVLQTIFYVSFVAYINYISNDKNKSLYYGISFSFTSFSNIFSNVIGYFITQHMSLFWFYSTILIISVFIQFLFFITKDQRDLQDILVQPFIQNINYQAVSIFKQIIQKNYSLFLVILLFAGLMNSVIFLFIPELIQRNGYSDDDITNYIFLGFLVTGTGQVLGGISSGKLAERFGEGIMIYISIVLNLLGIFIAQIGNLQISTILVMIGCFFLGYADSSISSLALIVVTKQISQSNHAFAGYNLCQVQQFYLIMSIGFGLSSIWWGSFNQYSIQYDMTYLYVTSIISLISFKIYQIYKDPKQNLVEEMSAN